MHIPKKLALKYKIRIAVCLFLVVFLLISFFNFIFKQFKNSTSLNVNSSTNVSTEENTKNNTLQDDITIKMTAIGDIMCHNTQYLDAYNKSTKTYDFSHFFTNVKSELSSADITIGNLETTFAGADRGYSSYPTFTTPEDLANNLKDIGIDVVSTANNHSLDKGYSGVVNTINVLDTVGISHMGTYDSPESQKEILIKEVNGLKIAFLSYTYGTNGIPIPSGKDYCINLIDKDLILSQLKQAKEKNVDLICVNMHWGVEYRLTPNDEQKELADFLFKNGADIILGSHPHVLEPKEKRTVTLDDGTEKECFVIYSLGNFISGQNKENTKSTIILNLQITKHTDNKITIDSAKYTPLYFHKKGSSGTKNYTLIDIKKSIANYENGTDKSIGSSFYNTLKSELTQIQKHVGEEI